MTGSGSPCGACKFLRRKCVRGCVFSPYFCHEQGAAHFAAIHRVFGASNVSKLLAHLPVNGRCEAAITIAYEAQARIQDPIYGCVSHIFALQQQVVSLQSQLASLREQAAQSLINGSSCSNYVANDHRPNGRLPSYTPPQDIQSWLQESESSCRNVPQYDQNSSTNNNVGNMNEIMNFNSIKENNQNSLLKEEDGSFSSFQEGSSYSIESLDMQMSYNKEWAFQENSEDLHSIAFGYIHH
ncbi:LOB domain-containing protein 29-like [Cynara cardunculus var. scolymus]|uniref:Lateral organ boundaries domain-containing protein n=1 Tax=Cynara cardunculus var. scolymus TaxID=59895 RepID=A0A118JVT0_CYNCS|nr:LOB domain-containing protein 29-like [Cynara cardunculus var. scolymus]KVH94269.1 lateral organ boundaries domain-containing protein [Cynara cardunculus var. scolymus]